MDRDLNVVLPPYGSGKLSGGLGGGLQNAIELMGVIVHKSHVTYPDRE